MGMNNPEEHEFEDFLKEILDAGHLEGAAEGITKLVIDKGEKALSPKQSFVFQKEVLDEFITKECKRCGGDIPYCEMYAAYDNGGYCSWCQHQIEKGN